MQWGEWEMEKCATEFDPAILRQMDNSLMAMTEIREPNNNNHKRHKRDKEDIVGDDTPPKPVYESVGLPSTRRALAAFGPPGSRRNCVGCKFVGSERNMASMMHDKMADIINFMRENIVFMAFEVLAEEVHIEHQNGGNDAQHAADGQ